MAGQLGLDIQAHFKDHPDPQTIREIQTALKNASPIGKETSGGAIGYALDRLIANGLFMKITGAKPARYALSGTAVSAAVSAEPRPARERASSAPRRGGQVPDAEDTEDAPAPATARAGRPHPCGYCSVTKPMQYHQDQCPRSIPGARGHGQDWYCSCSLAGHDRASDYAEYMADLEADEAERAARKGQEEEVVS